MSAQPSDDDLEAVTDASAKAHLQPLKRTKKQKAAIARAEARQAEAKALRKRSQTLAQIVNLHIGGYSFADIAAATGSSEAEIERMLLSETAMFVRTQPALRTYVRGFVSKHYLELLDNVMPRARDAQHEENLEAHDRALKILKEMARLHGAAAPIQSEVTVDAAPEAVERLVSALSAAQGQGYDASVFDVVDAEVVEDAVADAPRALQAASDAVERVSGNPDEETL